MKKLVLALMPILMLAACAPTLPASYSPQAQVAYKADDIINKLDLLTDAAISLNTNGLLSDIDTAHVRDFVLPAVHTVRILGVSGNPVAAVQAGLDALKGELSPAAHQKLDVAIAAIQVVLDNLK